MGSFSFGKAFGFLQGMALNLVLIDANGRRMLEKNLTPTSPMLRYELPLGSGVGVYFIRVSSPVGASSYES